MTDSTMSVQTTNQLKNGAVIQITAERFPEDAREACAARMVDADFTLDQARTSLGTGIGRIASMMRAANAKLERAESAYTEEQADDVPVRKQRDLAFADLAQRWSDVKTQVSRRLGSDALRQYGLAGDTPATPDALSKQTLNTINLLRITPRTHTSTLGEFNTVSAANYLEETQKGLARALGDVTAEAKELQSALGRRDAAAAEWTHVYQGCATLLEGYLRIGGRLDLAQRVRPTVRRASGFDVTPDVPSDPVAPPAEPPVTPEPSPAPAA